MASQKGIVITVGILAVITISSFLIWMIPQNNEAIFVISNFQDHIDVVKEIHNVIVDGIEIEFQNLLARDITPEQYIEIADVSSTQIKSQIIRLVESDAPEEWHDSYLNYIEALRKTNSQILETIIVANLIEKGSDQNSIEESLVKISILKQESKSFVKTSDELTP